MNAKRGPKEIEEMRFIKEGLKFDTNMKNLMMLGSVLEDDAISLSSDEEMDPRPTREETDEYIPHYPPRTLKEIYSLPHKNRGDLKDGLCVSNEEMQKVIRVIQSNELSPEELSDLLDEGCTANKSDVNELNSFHRSLISWKRLDGPQKQVNWKRCSRRTIWNPCIYCIGCSLGVIQCIMNILMHTIHMEKN